MGLFSKKIGIDLGTTTTQIYKCGKGIVLEEPSVVAIDKFDGKVLAVGYEANEMIGRTPDNIVAICPIKDGVIADFDITRAMLKSFISYSEIGGILKPIVYIAIPTGITEVEKRAVEEAAITSGAKSVSFIPEPLAAAIGAGMKIDDAAGNMIVDIGGGTTEVAVISLGGIVASKSIRLAGEALDSSIINFVKKEHGINIGDRMAEEVKLKVGNAYDDGENERYAARGRDVATGLPKEEIVTSNEIREAMKENLNQIMYAIRQTLERTPPELASDIIERGIVLSGGSANIKGLAKLIKSELNIEAHVAEKPENCVAIGIGLYIEKQNQR